MRSRAASPNKLGYKNRRKAYQYPAQIENKAVSGRNDGHCKIAESNPHEVGNSDGRGFYFWLGEAGIGLRVENCY